MAPQISKHAGGVFVLLCSTFLTSISAPAQTAEPIRQKPILLEPILLQELFRSDLTTIQTEDPADTGTTVIGATSLRTRGDGGGDPNAALTALPTVQTAGDSSVDAGVNGDDMLNLRPKEISISGGRTDQNSFIVDGVAVNSITGNEDPFGADDLSRETGQPGIYVIYGLHSQTQFPPASFIERATVIDSNASAQYGGFQGGVVDYELTPPKRESSGSITASFRSDALTQYKLGTEDGQNPLEVAKPEWSQQNLALELTHPLTENTGLVLGYSTRRAETEKDKDPQYVRERVESRSRSDYFRLGVEHELANGHEVGLIGSWSDYDQKWDSNFYRDLEVEQTNVGKVLSAYYQGELADRSLGGVALSGLDFKLSGSLQDNKTENLSDGNVMSLWTGATRAGWSTTALKDWCDPTRLSAGSLVSCREGGMGDRAYGDRRYALSGELKGDVWAGDFKIGASVERTEADRQGEGFVFNSVTTQRPMGLAGGYVCPAGAEDCLSDQFFNIRIVQPAYDVSVDATRADAYAELSQEWGAFGLRAGLRADYNDYLRNLDFSPRLVGTWKPLEGLTFTAGANRYYSDDYITYAIHDAVPRGENQRRTATGDVVGDWTTAIVLTPYRYNQGDLKTPYTDELSLGLVFKENFTGGTWRARMIDRQGRDQFAGVRGDSSIERRLTNDGESSYRSYTLEYEREWDAPSFMPRMDRIGLGLSTAFADRKISAESYFGAGIDAPEEFFWYQNASYTRPEFDVVTGNFDIPVRASAELNTSWLDGALEAGLSADVIFGYKGARYTGDEANRVNPIHGSQPHYLYEEFDYKPVVTLNFSGRARVAEVAGNPVYVDLHVANLLNETGNRISTEDNPWIQGRSLWLGTSVEW
ncbi:TonB-dependent receptor [Neomegalonema perideroedes]|uniref:TonB-dependent receptor plug domain-containing protein n=1 Tax=Neomegalonema perideroedes TaxID=217219 RepID=UPI0003818974|nr:TonB-dependent receptor plug domain-containing protein [Neomegalonema perideroedes]